MKANSSTNNNDGDLHMAESDNDRREQSVMP